MTAQILHHHIATAFRFLLHQTTQIGDFHTCAQTFEGFGEDGFAGVYQGLVPMYIFTQYKRTAIVGPKAVQFGRNIDVYEVAFL